MRLATWKYHDSSFCLDSVFHQGREKAQDFQQSTLPHPLYTLLDSGMYILYIPECINSSFCLRCARIPTFHFNFLPRKSQRGCLYGENTSHIYNIRTDNFDFITHPKFSHSYNQSLHGANSYVGGYT